LANWTKSMRLKASILRAMDLVILALFAPIWLPLLLATVLMVSLEQILTWDFGPLIVHELRVSRGRMFRLYKLNMFKESYRLEYFRTSQGEVSHTILQKQNPESLRFVGRLMKKYYLDELAQIFNVLIGDMAIVGPRPSPHDSLINDQPPRQLQKTGFLSAELNDAKTEHNTISRNYSDMEYLDICKNRSVFSLIYINIIIIIDGLMVVLMGKGK